MATWEKGVEAAISHNPDMELVAVFTRRNPEDVILEISHAEPVHISEVESYVDKIDIMILCGGSATDLPEQGPYLAGMFNTVDSYDNHGKIPEYFAKMDGGLQKGIQGKHDFSGMGSGAFFCQPSAPGGCPAKGKHLYLLGEGCKPGPFRCHKTGTRVKNAVQYTIPVEEALDRVRRGENPILTPRERHLRQCYVVAKEGADRESIENQIKTMPNYFKDYDTEVIFIEEEELKANHAGMPHGVLSSEAGRPAIIISMIRSLNFLWIWGAILNSPAAC